MPSRRRIPALLFLLPVVASIILLWHLRNREAPPAPVAAEASPVAPAPKNAPERPDTLPKPTAPSAPLPPREARLPDIAATLQSRADAGDRKAACRLGIELLRCDRLLRVHAAEAVAGIVEAELALEAQGKLDQANQYASVNLRYVELAEACSVLSAGLLAQGPRYLRQAALAGEPEAMLRYADGQSLDWGNGYRYLRTPEFDLWRAEAPVVLQRALSAGRPEAVHLLHQAYSNDQGTLQSLFPQDPLLAHAYFLLQRRLFGSSQAFPEALVPEALDAGQQRQAEHLADRWFDSAFHSQRLDFMTSLHGLAPLYDPSAVTDASFKDHAFCEPVKARADG